MATYLKRTSKLFDLSLSRNSADVSLRDLICPVCRGILIEPVSLPCTHNLCLRCLKGTFAHNSLSCPLCRVRVGSWLRTATKSETLVNNELWQLIRTRFPKEVESKDNGNDEDVVDETDEYAVPDRIISNAGDIRREYEAQLQLAQEELRRQREAERIASEALIRKIQAEEEQKLAQLAEDKLLAKSIAKKQYNENSKETLKYSSYDEYMKSNNTNSSCKVSKEKKDDARHNSTQVQSKVKDQFAISRTLNVNKEGCGAINMTTKSKKCSPEPGCSNNVKIYGLQSKEELHVPNDVINSKKKTLAVEVCVTKMPSDDARIGSAESGGSRDSINQEIHHFKPIKAVPRTPLLLSADGKQIDPKLIRVTAVIKRVMNVSLKPPSPIHSKRVIGCSWSAFKRQWKPKQPASSSLPKKLETEKLPSSPSKSKLHEDNRLAIDTNKNYTKKIINGVRKLPKKLLSSPKFSHEEKQGKCDKSKQKPKRRKAEPEVQEPLLFSDNVVENIAERIKRRKNVAPVPKKIVKSSAKKELQAEGSVELEKEDSEEDIVKEQKRIEEQVQQEKRDFELAMRLQAQFNEMERVPVRTRRSKRAIENTVQSTDSEGDKSPLRKRKCRQARQNVL